ncbi:Phytochrome-like protein cph2 [Anatilimnocola aggregata]|uniref:Phytochrome-like protein cph2 n=1 Tax=Anatilimnocola aggregata TaxID=2528021 RepID=A0A517YJZ7_9BACT|nr:EAL domain-containing protein [Anatilimnocola aggregata]QDU30549.1 Phytochrome-like protein cph2 [Anatilimnocola aggregata]
MIKSPAIPNSMKVTWFLTGRLSVMGKVESIDVTSFPFQIGRRHGLPLSLSYATVSGVHAEIIFEEGYLHIRDAGSTNGTFVNGKQVHDKVLLNDGDLIQFADVPFRVGMKVPVGTSSTLCDPSGASERALSLIQFDKLMTDRAVVPHFQPILDIRSGKVTGYEVLGRSNLFGLKTPRDMFLAASQLDLEAELSTMLRVAGLECAPQEDTSLSLYLNTHPAEIVTTGLYDSLASLVETFPKQAITLEVHEASATDLASMKELKRRLHDLGIKLAYDDFGVGQSRLVELTEVSPDVVKFDMQLIRDIHLSPPRHQQMVAKLVQMVRELGSLSLAEGVESEAEHRCCCEMGFELGQGYYYGKPLPAPELPTPQIGRLRPLF